MSEPREWLIYVCPVCDGITSERNVTAADSTVCCEPMEPVRVVERAHVEPDGTVGAT